MKLNQDKCHFLLSGHKHEVMFAKIGHSKIWKNCTKKLLGDETFWYNAEKLEEKLKH